MRLSPLYLLGVSLFLALGPDLSAQSACVSGSAGGGNASPEGTCSGGNLHQRVNYTFEAPTEAEHCCQNNCWNGASTMEGSHVGFAYGECQLAGAGQSPVCFPDFSPVFYWGYSNGDAIFRNQLRDVQATATGCNPQLWETESSEVSIDGDCCANRCNDSSGCNATIAAVVISLVSLIGVPAPATFRL